MTASLHASKFFTSSHDVMTIQISVLHQDVVALIKVESATSKRPHGYGMLAEYRCDGSNHSALNSKLN